MRKQKNDVITLKKGRPKSNLTTQNCVKRYWYSVPLTTSFAKESLICWKKNEAISVTEIYVKLRLEQSVASQHLAILRRAGVVQTDRMANSSTIHWTKIASSKFHVW